MNETEIQHKQKFWRKILIIGFGVIIVSLLAMVALFLSGMSEVKARTVGDSELEREIAMFAARKNLLPFAAKWTLPFAILASVMINIARYKLRKLKKYEKAENHGDSSY